MSDPIMSLADAYFIEVGAELEKQLVNTAGTSPVREIVRVLKKRASESLAALVICNLHDPKEVTAAIALQNEVKRYDEFMVGLREIVASYKQAQQKLGADEREELVRFLNEDPDGREIVGAVEGDPMDPSP